MNKKDLYDKYEIYHYEIGNIKDPSSTTAVPIYELLQITPIYTNGAVFNITNGEIQIPLNTVCHIMYTPMEYNGDIDFGTQPSVGSAFDGWRFFNAATFGLLFDYQSRLTAPKLDYGKTYEIEFGNFYIHNITTGNRTEGTKRTIPPYPNILRLGSENINMGFHWAKVYSNNNLLYDIYGCRYNSKCGLFDRANGRFIESSNGAQPTPM